MLLCLWNNTNEKMSQFNSARSKVFLWDYSSFKCRGFSWIMNKTASLEQKILWDFKVYCFWYTSWANVLWRREKITLGLLIFEKRKEIFFIWSKLIKKGILFLPTSMTVILWNLVPVTLRFQDMTFNFFQIQ